MANNHGTAATTVANNVNNVRKEPVVVNQGPTRSTSNTQTQTAAQTHAQPSPHASTNTGSPTGSPTGTPPTGSGTPPTGDTGGDTGGSSGSSNQNETPAQPQKLDGLAIDELAALPEKEREEKYKELAEQGFDVEEIKNKVETTQATSNNPAPKGNDGRKNAGEMKGWDKDPDWGKPLDDKFDIQQGDFIEFLMKDVVLASAAWTGNKVFGGSGYFIYKGTSWAYHKIVDKSDKADNKYQDDKEKSEKARRENQEKTNNEKLNPDIIKNNDKTSDYSKKILDIRKKLLAKDDPELKNAQALVSYVRDLINGEIDMNSAVKEKNGKYTVTRNYKDDKGKEQSQKITFDEKSYQTLMAVHQNVQKAISTHGNSPELRKAMEENITSRFRNLANLREKEKIFAADYAAAILIEKAARMNPDEIKKKGTEQEFTDLVNGEAKLAFYHHLYDIEHRKSAFKGGKDKDGKEISPLDEISDTCHAGVQQAVKNINDSQYQETYMKQGLPEGTKKEPPHNAALQKVFINGKSEYAPELEGMTSEQQEVSLKYMQQDAFEGYNRSDRLNREQQKIDGEISAITADSQNAGQRKTELEQRKKNLKNEHDRGTGQRDVARAAALNNFRGNSK